MRRFALGQEVVLSGPIVRPHRTTTVVSGRKARSRLNPPMTLYFRDDVQRSISPNRFIVGISSLKFGINVHFGVRR
ncbi:MAG TPA: hypothetical protein DCE20_04955 [Gammaproteobacteria bacterium]|nr:hypothetical protein [Gammaproteobacteria bacterium]